MQAIRKSAYRSTLQIVWRNRFPVEREKRAGVLVLLARDQRLASRGWVQKLFRFCGLSALFEALWLGRRFLEERRPYKIRRNRRQTAFR